jgi:capsular polysaccharide transport system ATP-binding protein
MIELSQISKQYPTGHGLITVLDKVDMVVLPGQKIGILGGNGAGKSTLIRLLSGAERPTSGQISRNMSISWPLAFGGAFQSALTGSDNLRFICRIYGVDPLERAPFVEEFSELGKFMREPMRTYSSGMRARLAFAISIAIEFDCFLIDEVISVGDARFHEKCRVELFEKRKDRAFIIVSHEAHNIREHCDSAGVLRNGRLTLFDDVDGAYRFYEGAAA